MHRTPRRTHLLLLATAAALAAGTPATAQAPDPARLIAAVDSLLSDAVQAGQVAGAVVAVARGAEAPVVRAYGRADVENDVAMTPEHVLPIASVTKQFTAAAILQLVEEGRIRLDEDITAYLPEAPTGGHAVTIRQLLQHTSGMVDVTEQPGFRSIERLDLPPDSTLALVRDVPFHFAPGEQMRYSNSGYLLLGMLLEAVTERPYADHVAERLLAPAGMASSRYCDPRALIPRRASGYEYTPDGLLRARFVSFRIPFAAGGLCATAADLVEWTRALHDGRIVSPALHAELVRPARLSGGRATRYGLGLAVGELAGRPAWHHGGGIQGFTSYAAYFPDDSLSVAVLVNTMGPLGADAVVEAMARALPGSGAVPGRPASRGEPGARGEADAAVIPAPADLSRFVGRYGGAEVTLGPSGLHVTGLPFGEADLRPVGGTTFTDGRGLYTFEGDEGDEGVPTALWADLVWAMVRWDRVGEPAARSGL